MQEQRLVPKLAWRNPEITEAVRIPWALARELAECYRGTCRTDHSDIHGDAARAYHGGRRADFAAAERAQQRVNLTLPGHDPDVTEIEALRQRQNKAIERLAEWKKGIARSID